MAYGDKILAELKAAGIRAIMDTDDSQSPGWKFAEYEMRGVPLRIEIGPRDMEAGKAMVARRDTGEKAAFEVAGAQRSKSRELLDAIQKNLYDRAVAFRRRTRFALLEQARSSWPSTARIAARTRALPARPEVSPRVSGAARPNARPRSRPKPK